MSSGFLGRYREFDVSLHHILSPPGTFVNWALGVNIAFNFNEGIRYMLKYPQFEWVWFMGDDHTFEPDILYRLLKHKVDFVVPIVLKRSIPFQTVITASTPEGKPVKVSMDDVKDWHGLVDITSGAVGNAGLLVSRRVCEAIQEPWYENGKTHPEFGGSDLYFCKKVREAGFKMYVDSDLSMGHINHAFFWVERNPETGLLQPDIKIIDGY